MKGWMRFRALKKVSSSNLYPMLKANFCNYVNNTNHNKLEMNCTLNENQTLIIFYFHLLQIYLQALILETTNPRYKSGLSPNSWQTFLPVSVSSPSTTSITTALSPNWNFATAFALLKFFQSVFGNSISFWSLGFYLAPFMKGWMRFRAQIEGQFFQFIPYAEGELLQLLQQYESQQIRNELHTK
ncbi:Hypothetical_protein [Hexamita inflata]|uniref:Hypothetical_protein n=1 Tax=Hexamita inflata TaxID=28002 RepID=A0AA86TAN2_9EUKA|nr:Hypothetical protein HINF_LOCUS1379 [Hexamita inflata]